MSDQTPAPRRALDVVNGGDLLVALMEALGVDTAFGVVSVHNMPLVDAISERLRFVPVRHEAAAVNAADAYGRVRGTVGIALTSTGTGAGNAAGSLIEALATGSRVLHVTGQIESRYLGQGRGFIHETKDQAGMLAAVSKAAYTVEDVAGAPELLARAAREAATAPYGPVSVEWPIDLQYQRHEIPALDVAPRPEAALPSASALDEAAALIAAAERPLLWVGGGALDARDEVLELLTRTRAGLLTSNSGRGVVGEGHGACIGNFAMNPAVAPVRERADLLVSIGTHFRSNETGDYALELPAAHVQIDLDPAAIGRVYAASAGLAGDAAAVLRALLDRLPERTATDGTWLTEIAAARRGARQGLRASIGWQAEICDAVRSAFPRTAVLARDVTIPSSMWGNRLLAVEDPSVNVFPRGGGIGQGLAMGIGGALARPDVPSLILAGDGGFAVHLGELGTLAQENPWAVVLLFNDGGYGVLRNTQDGFVGRRSGVDLATPDFGLLSQAYGLPYWKVKSVDEIEGALAAALSVRGAVFVEVDVDALGPIPKPFTPPVSIPGVD
ncbi:acetolactate synthase-1/2/3 large subunit [Actinocorallia herbida]|uniref:Acetolactate synthase-1/2/3 large subunit n=1 Tax=Actinocorallia herbida TaxID=58109 RepID=A0A3N1D699_9ACTN|nr:thiamine pyrophosphate-binding protein [Actinocorallia herbida]ROO89071.1 acetolactate synthase-1/2/3 large subunit [Actinocorallia herbida]